MLRRLEMTLDQFAQIIDRAHKQGLHAIVTVFSLALVDQADQLPWDAYKTASPDIIHTPLIERLARTGRPLILSTGAATLEEVGQGLAAAEAAGAGDRTALLQCVSSYPTSRDNAELGGIGALADITHAPVGYSDHTPDIDTGAAAVELGAAILEKHLTYDRAARGPDHAASLESDGLRRYAAGAKAARPTPWPESIPRVKRVLSCENDVRRLSRQSLTTRAVLKAGHYLTPEDLTFKRPGTGLPPGRFDAMRGSQLRRDVEADMPLTQEDLV
jgi:sialic acid synthase SpsE